MRLCYVFSGLWLDSDLSGSHHLAQIRKLNGPWSASRAVSGKAQRGDVVVLYDNALERSQAPRGACSRSHSGRHPAGELSDDRDL